MTTLRVEQQGEDLIIRVPPEANASLDLHPGDTVVATRGENGEVSFAPTDVDHQLRSERNRAFLRRYRSQF